eukprot:SAG31_NODE_498_length_14861_cov_3.405026_14_plen_97_part_00
MAINIIRINAAHVRNSKGFLFKTFVAHPQVALIQSVHPTNYALADDSRNMVGAGRQLGISEPILLQRARQRRAWLVGVVLESDPIVALLAALLSVA